MNKLPKWIQSLSNIGEQSQREIVQKMETCGLADDSYAAVKNIKEQRKEIIEK